MKKTPLLSFIPGIRSKPHHEACGHRMCVVSRLCVCRALPVCTFKPSTIPVSRTFRAPSSSHVLSSLTASIENKYTHMCACVMLQKCAYMCVCFHLMRLVCFNPHCCIYFQNMTSWNHQKRHRSFGPACVCVWTLFDTVFIIQELHMVALLVSHFSHTLHGLLASLRLAK